MTAGSPSPTLTRGRAWTDREVTICGVDLSGFSVWVEDEIRRDGSGAVEAVADTLEAFFVRWNETLAGAGFHLEAFLGDGLLSVGPALASPGARAALEADLAGALARARPPGPARLALGSGDLWRGRIGGWNGRWLPLATGPAIAACHARLQAAKAGLDGARASAPWGAAVVAPRPAKLYEAALTDEIAVVACLRARDVRMLIDDLETLAPRLQASADAVGGVLESATHDDAGLLLRAAFPQDASGLADILEFAREVSRLEVTGSVAVGVAAGKVFRTAAPWAAGGCAVVQGAAVNRAAKLAKSGRGLRIAASARTTSHRRPPSRAEPVAVHPTLGALDGADALDTFRAAAPRDGGGAPLHIVAEPGVGKSFLLRAFAQEPRADPTVLVAATPQHCGDALWIWARALEDLAASRPEIEAALAIAPPASVRALAGRLVPARRGRDEADLGQIAHLVLSLLKAVPPSRPQLILLDDLQWADALSVTLLARVVDECPGVQIVTASRPNGTFAALLGPSRQLAPLSREGLSQVLLSAGMTRLDLPALEQIARLSGGAPLFALQMARHWQEAGELPAGGLDKILERRLARLDPHARAVLRILALARRPLSAAEVARIGDRPERRTRDLLAELRRRGLVEAAHARGAAETFQMAHALIGDRALAQTPAGARPALHARLARRLSVRGVRVGGGEIGAHYASAGEPLRAALRDLRDADAALGGGDYVAALTLYRRAETLLPADGGADLRRSEAAAGRALAAWGVGRVSEAAGFAHDALTALDRHLGGGDPHAGAKRRRLITLLGRGDALPARARAALLRASVARAEAGLFCGDLRSMLAGNLASVRIAARAEVQAEARARGLCTLGLLAGLTRLDGAAALAYRAANRSLSGPHVAYSGASEGVWRLAFGRWAQGEACLARAAGQLGAASNPQLTEVILTLQALAAQFQGRWTEAEALFRQLEVDARLRGNDLHVAWGIYGAAMPMLHTGRCDEAAAAAETAHVLLGPTGDRQSELICLGIAAQANARLDRLQAALSFAERGVDLARSMPPLNFGSLEGYAGPAAAALIVAAHPDATPALRAQATRLVPAALRVLSDFARIFPIGRPRLLALRSLATPDRAARLAAAAVRESARRRMVGECWGAAWIQTTRTSS